MDKKLHEAISLSKYKDLVGDVELWDYKNSMTDIFNGKHRKIIGVYGPEAQEGDPLTKQQLDDIESDSTYFYLKTFFSDYNFEITPEGYAKNIGRDVKNNRDLKISKALNQLLKFHEKRKKVYVQENGVDLEDEEAVKKFLREKPYYIDESMTTTSDIVEWSKTYQDDLAQNNFDKRLKEKVFVVVSKHPYDVLGASTDKSWTSCLNMGDDKHDQGCNADHFRKSLKMPYLMAFSIKKSELKKGRDALRKPRGRMMIYPLPKEYGEGQDYEFTTGEIYGERDDDLSLITNDFVDNVLNVNIDDSGYQQDAGSYYDEIRRYGRYNTEAHFNYEKEKGSFSHLGDSISIDEEYENFSREYYVYDVTVEISDAKKYKNLQWFMSLDEELADKIIYNALMNSLTDESSYYKILDTMISPVHGNVTDWFDEEPYRYNLQQGYITYGRINVIKNHYYENEEGDMTNTNSLTIDYLKKLNTKHPEFESRVGVILSVWDNNIVQFTQKYARELGETEFDMSMVWSVSDLVEQASEFMGHKYH